MESIISNLLRRFERLTLPSRTGPVRGALIAFMVATSQAQAEVTRAAQPSRCCNTPAQRLATTPLPPFAPLGR